MDISTEPMSCFLKTFAAGLLIVSISLDRARSSEALVFQRDIQPLLTKYCAGCHNEDDQEADVQLHHWDALSKGSPKGALYVSGNAKASLLYQVISGDVEPKMPPDDEPQPSDAEIAIIKRWIDEGASYERVISNPLQLPNVPAIPSKYRGNQPILSLGRISENRWLLGMPWGVAVKQSQWTTTLPIAVSGKVAQIRPSRDRSIVSVASGIPGVGGQVTLLSATPGGVKLLRVIEGHRDTLYTAVVSPDNQTVATGGYDRIVRLWNMESGKLIREFTGHNGAIYDLDFDGSGTVLASASADETIKIWHVPSGQRLDTLGQCEAEQYAVRFASAQNLVVAVGGDKRIRIWQLKSLDRPSVSPLLSATFAHESPVVGFALSPDGNLVATAGEDMAIKLWRFPSLRPVGELGKTMDTPTGLEWSNSETLAVTAIDGGWYSFDISKALSHRATPDADSIPLENLDPQPVGEGDEIEESPFTRSPTSPQMIPNLGNVSGKISESDALSSTPGDWYSIGLKRGETRIISIDAARSKSPLDSLIDVLDEQGKPILRTRLQAIRESYFTFRGKDSNIADDFRLHRWEDMELNEYLYAAGEVVKLWLYPRGPDSGFKVYPGEKSRYTFFDTTATTHALNEPAWIVRELASNEESIPNGLPVFDIFYSNDDESTRRLGRDSQLTFTAPKDGRYLIRVRDSRGLYGDSYAYKLSIAARNPRFSIATETKDITLRPGSGTEFAITAERWDGLDGKIDLQLEGLPEGVECTKELSIEPGQIRAVGTLVLPSSIPDSTPKEFAFVVKPHASFANGHVIESPAVEIKAKISDKPAMQFKLVASNASNDSEQVQQISIVPGTTISLKLVIERGDLKGDISFGRDDSGRNLPHGVFIDNIGLNGLLIPAGQSTREVFITAAPVAKAQTREFHIKASVDGNPTTRPIAIRVEHPISY